MGSGDMDNKEAHNGLRRAEMKLTRRELLKTTAAVAAATAAGMSVPKELSGCGKAY